MIVDERKMKGGGGGEKKKKRKKISYARLVSSLTAASLIMRDCELEELGGGEEREGRRRVIKEDNIDGGVTKSSFIRCVKFHSKTRKEANRDPITALYK